MYRQSGTIPGHAALDAKVDSNAVVAVAPTSGIVPAPSPLTPPAFVAVLASSGPADAPDLPPLTTTSRYSFPAPDILDAVAFAAYPLGSGTIGRGYGRVRRPRAAADPSPSR